ncbi:hypothetical protein ACOBR2_02225 [Telmatobacter bradus]|uniref:hypothetical protein n=1 Tax=Telmatobacter bradus TaxID=474953 RepID=UPI003B42964E
MFNIQTGISALAFLKELATGIDIASDSEIHIHEKEKMSSNRFIVPVTLIVSHVPKWDMAENVSYWNRPEKNHVDCRAVCRVSCKRQLGEKFMRGSLYDVQTKKQAGL